MLLQHFQQQEDQNVHQFHLIKTVMVCYGWLGFSLSKSLEHAQSVVLTCQLNLWPSDGSGAAKAIKSAIMKVSNWRCWFPQTSAPANEKGESGPLFSVLGKDVPDFILLNHLQIRCCVAVETIATIEAIRHNYVPKTAGTKELSDYIEKLMLFMVRSRACAISNTGWTQCCFLLNLGGLIHEYF